MLNCLSSRVYIVSEEDEDDSPTAAEPAAAIAVAAPSREALSPRLSRDQPAAGGSSPSHPDYIYRPLVTVDEVIQEIGFGRFQCLLVLFCAGCWFCFGIDLTVPGVFIPTVQCEWQLSDTETALIAVFFYVGGLLGTGILVLAGDRIGRKQFILLFLLLLVVFGVLGGVPISDQKSIGYPWLLMCRFMLGMGYGGHTIVPVYLCEFIPIKARGVTTFVLQIFFGSGYSIAALIGLLLIGLVGWQWYSAVMVAGPSLLMIFFLIFIPETPRYLFVSGRRKDSQALLIKMARFNRKPDIVSLIHFESKELEDLGKKYLADDVGNRLNRLSQKRQKLLERLKKFVFIFNKEYRRATVLIFCLWFFVAFVYGGGIWLPTALLQDGSVCGLGNSSGLNETSSNRNSTLNYNGEYSNNTTLNQTGEVDCENATDSNFYLRIAGAAFGDLPGIFLSVLLIEVLGRKLTLTVTGSGAAVSILPLVYCGLVEILNGYLVTVLLFFFRGFIIGTYITLYVYIAEVYPTHCRGNAFGVCGVALYLAVLLSPFAALALINYNYHASIGMYAGMAMLSGVIAFALPVETKGHSLKDE